MRQTAAVWFSGRGDPRCGVVLTGAGKRLAPVVSADPPPWHQSLSADARPAFAEMMTERRDQDAVTVGLTWELGRVENYVDRIEMLEGQMYWRVSPDLLRLRIRLTDQRSRSHIIESVREAAFSCHRDT